MARLLHKLLCDTRRWCRWSVKCVLLAALITSIGCILPPDLPKEPDIAYAPYILPEEIDPPVRVKEIIRGETTPTFELVVQDRNAHDQLNFALFSDNPVRGLIATGSQASEDDQGERAQRYRITIENLDLCAAPPDNNSETLTLYVADAGFTSLRDDDNAAPEVADDAFIVSHSWILEYTNDACS